MSFNLSTLVVLVTLVWISACGSEVSSGPGVVHPANESSLGRVHMFNEYREPGVVVLAVSSADAGSDPVLEIQMKMLELLVESGPVFVAAADTTSRNRVTTLAQRNPKIKEALRGGAVRILEVEHTGPWIRDYGPQIGTSSEGVLVLDAQYTDVRTIREAARRQAEIDRERLDLIKCRESIDNKLRTAFEGEDDSAEDCELELTQADPVEQKRQIDDRLQLLAQKKDVYADHGIFARAEDDESPFFLAQASFHDTAFRLIPTGISLDGGNLVRLSQDVCALTTDVVPSNKENSDIDRILHEVYRCNKVLYLAPLPGPVIKHADMFVLPADGNLVLLASYDPHDELIARHWQVADDETRDLTMEAALAMNRNEVVLKRAGFRVERVPAPLPRVDVEYGVYFPTNLNALVRRGAGGPTSVLVPTYRGYQEDVQSRAYLSILTAFDRASVHQVEATEAGRRQGALHCLSLIVPQNITVFADSINARKWNTWANTAADMADQQRKALAQLTDGVWRFDGDDTLISFNTDGTFVLLDGSSLARSKYRMRNGGRELELLEQGDSVHFKVEWPRENALELVTGDHRIALTRNTPSKADRQPMPTAQ